MTAYRFAILRYVPDPVRQEAINAGVVVLSGESSGIAVRILQQDDAARLKWLGMDDDIDFLQDLAVEIGDGRSWNLEMLERAHREWGEQFACRRFARRCMMTPTGFALNSTGAMSPILARDDRVHTVIDGKPARRYPAHC